MVKLLVTGSKGLVGKELVKKLQKKGHEIREFDIKIGNDIRDLTEVKNSVEDVDGVIHLAALSRVITGYKNPYSSVITNIMGTTNILESIRQSNQNCWMIYASSREAYGEAFTVVNESKPVDPINVYGASKVGAEFITLTYGRNYCLKTFVIRFSNIYGGYSDYEDRVIPQFITQALSDSDLTLNGGHQKLDFVHLSDATEGLIALIEKILEKQNLPNKIFHFVTGKSTSLLELAQKIKELTNSKSQIKFFPSREYDVNSFVGDPQLSKDILGWTAKISLEEGLLTYIKLIESKN